MTEQNGNGIAYTIDGFIYVLAPSVPVDKAIKAIRASKEHQDAILRKLETGGGEKQ
jgi:hypothetical protein